AAYQVLEHDDSQLSLLNSPTLSLSLSLSLSSLSLSLSLSSLLLSLVPHSLLLSELYSFSSPGLMTAAGSRLNLPHSLALSLSLSLFLCFFSSLFLSALSLTPDC